MRVILKIAAILLVVSACRPKPEVVTTPGYIQEIDQWHADRVMELKSPTGWLNIAGLYWLHEGVNSFGAHADNELVFPSRFEFEKAGFFSLENGLVKQRLLPGVEVSSGGETISGTWTVYHPDSSRQPTMETGLFRWFVIKRDSKYGVRLRDLDHKDLLNFHGIQRFPVDARWRVIARWEPTPGRTIPITNILGQTTPQPAPGVLVFSIDGKEYRLDALDEGGDELFIIFGDSTNTNETYGAGRYLYVPKPDSTKTIVVDFNKSENPPCAFTEFATCPLPPVQNVLALAIEAGEWTYKSH